ncbi:MAG: SseB family protein [Kocuria sp.]|nr:SseB family protein [Kocuria sp.]
MTQDQQQPTRRSRNRPRPRSESRSGSSSGSHAAAQFTDEQITQSLRNELDSVGNWILGVLNAPPGWDRMEVDLKPQGGRVWLRITEHRGGRELPGTVGPITRGTPVLRRIKRLQSLFYRPGRGTWLSTTITITADGWPQPQYSFSTRHNFDERPPTLGDEGAYQLEDGLEHLESFPRTQQRIPDWLAHLAQEAGHTIEVLAPEAEAEATPQGTVHPRLREAIAGFAAAPSDTSLIEVMRQCTTGELLVDATGSTVVRTSSGEVDPESDIRLQSFVEPDGTRSLVAYTAEADARAMFERSGQLGEPELLRQSATAVLELVGSDQQYDHLILDPGGISCRIPRRQIDWLLSSPRNDVAKNGLLAGNIPQVLSGLVAANSVLLLGVRPAEDGGAHDVTPVWTKPDDGQEADTILLFTSAAEVAALDPTLEIRSASGREVLQYALTTGASHVCINARPPVVRFSVEDIRSVLDSVTDSSGIRII